MTASRVLRVGINAIPLLSPRTGIGQYIYHLSTELLRLAGVSPRFFYGARWADELRRVPLDGVVSAKTVIKKVLPRPYIAFRSMIQAGFSAGCWRTPIDVYHEPAYLAYRFRGPTVVTVHDLSWIRYPETHPRERLDAMDRYFPRSLERASVILTDCEFVKNELVNVFGVDPGKIRSVLLGVSADYHPRTSEACATILAKYELEYGGYFLSVGTLEPRKNIPTLIDAFTRLSEREQRRCPLVLVGMRGWLTSSIEARIHPLVEKGVLRLLGYVPDELMPAIYAAARAFVFPSLYEGFGLPALEAMAAGVPVLASGSSSLPEVVGDAGLLVDPLDVDGMSHAMHRLLEDPSWVDELSLRGIERAKAFSWKTTAEKTLGSYRHALAA